MPNFKALIAVLGAGMDTARNNADGQAKLGTITISRQAYEALYYAAYHVKKELERAIN